MSFRFRPKVKTVPAPALRLEALESRDVPAPFTAGNLVVYRVGDGSAALTNAATAVFLDEYTPTGTLVQSIALPTATSGSNRTLTASGTATSEGLLTRSADGRYLLLAGYDAVPGTASVAGTASATVNRVIGRVDASGAVDTTTALSDASTGNNPRGVASTNGTDLWITGGAGGIRYTTLGSSTSVQLSTTLTNIRGTSIYNNQLYISTGSGSAIRIGAVGSGTPTTAGQTITNIPGGPTAGSPYGFFFADLTPAVAGVDTLYVADDASPGIQKFSLVGGSWVSNQNIPVLNNNARGLTGIVSGSTVTLYATGGTNQTQLITLQDTSGYNATITGTPNVIATAAANTVFRGVAFTPQSPPLPTLSINDVSLTEGNSGTKTFTFTVSLSAPAPAGGVTFDIGTANGTATAPGDYVARALTGQTIAAGQSNYTFDVTVNGDTTVEPNETFFVNVTNVTGATILDGQGLGTITNDDVANTAPTITAPANAATNEDTSFAFTGGNAVSVADPDAGDTQTVTVATTNGTSTVATGGGATVTNNGTASVTVVGTLAQVNAALAGLTFNPTANFNGTAQVRITANDGVNAPAERTTNIVVSAVNDAPALIAGNVQNLAAINEDPATNPGTLVSDILPAAAVTDPDFGALRGIAVTSANNTSGTWQFSTDGGTNWTNFGAPGVSSARLLAADAGTRVRFVPGANFNGTVTGGLTFRAWDQTTGGNGGTADATANGNDTAFSTGTADVGITVSPVNDAPVGANNTLTTPEDTPLAFAAADFGFGDPNDGPPFGTANAFAGVVIDTLPAAAAGALRLNGTPVAAGDFVTAAQIAAGQFTFVPAPNANGTALGSFAFRVRDDGGTADGGQNTATAASTLTLNVTAVNDPPVANPDPVTVDEDATATVVSVLANDTDPDGDAPTVTAVTQGTSGGTVTLVGGVVRYAPAPDFAGTDSFTYTISDGNGGTATGTVTVTVSAVNDAPTFAALADVTVDEDSGPFTRANFLTGLAPGGGLDEAGQSVALSAASNNAPLFSAQPAVAADGTLTFTPAPNAFGTATVTVTATDGGSGTAPNVNTFSRTFTITVNPVNDPPTFTATGGATLYAEDAPAVALFTGAAVDAGEPGQNIDRIVLTVQFAAEPGSEFLGIDGTAFALADGTTGTTAGGLTVTVQNDGVATVTVSKAGGVTPAAAATLLNGLTYRNASQAPTDIQRVVSIVSVRDDGGATSTGPAVTAAVNVVGVNDAPVLSGANNFPAIDEGATTNPGVAIADLLSGFVNDVDEPGTVRGLALTGTNTTNGTWEYTADGSGLNWLPVGPVSDAQALLLNADANTRLRFVPNANFSGTVTAAVTFRAWDQSTGTVGAKVNTVPNGDTTAFSAATATADITVNPVNDAPVLTLPGGAPTYTENGPAVALDATATVTDADTATLTGATVSITAGFATGQDVLAFTPVGNVTGTYDPATGVLALSGADTLANYQLALRSVTYANGSENPSTASRTVSVVVTDGTTPSGAVTKSVTVAAVNDAPVLANLTGPRFYVLGGPAVLVSPAGTAADVDSADFDGGQLTVQGSQGTDLDLYAIGNVGPVSVTGGQVSVAGTGVVGTVTGGTGSTPLVVTLNGSATAAAVQAVLRAVTFSTTSASLGGRLAEFTLTDGDGGTSATLSVTVNIVQGDPTVTGATTNEDTPTAGGLVITPHPSATGTTHFKIGGITNGTLATAGGVAVANGDFVTVAEGAAGLRFSPGANLNSGFATFGFQVQAATSASDPGLIGAAVSATVTVNAVNDAPTFAPLTGVTVNEGSGPFAQAGFVTGVAPGPVAATDETSQTVTVTVANDNPSLFSARPTIVGGELRFTPAPDAFGTATVTVTATDDGPGTAPNANTFSRAFTITVNAVNDDPTVTPPAGQTINEDGTTGPLSFTVGDSETAAGSLSVTAASNNPALVPDANILLGGSGAARTVTVTPVPNQFGTATITLRVSDGVATTTRTFVVTVNPVNDAPDFAQPTNVTVVEDSGPFSQTGFATGFVPGPANESGQTVLEYLVSNDNNALFSVQPSIAADGTLTFTPAANAHGAATVTVQVRDSGGTANNGTDTSVARTFTVTINPVNDAPSFTKGPDATVVEDAGAQSISNWAADISAGPADESGQTLTFVIQGITYSSPVYNSDAAFFATLPSIDPVTGALTFRTAPNANGTATVTVRLRDNGGTADGGADTSGTQTFVITATPVNDAPTFAQPADVTVNEDGGAFTQSGFATGFDAGPADEDATQAVSAYLVSNGNAALFSVQPAIDASGRLMFTPAANAHGAATVTVQVRDDGGTANNGTDTSVARTFTVTINPVNDAPTFVAADPPASNEDAGAQTVPNFVTGFVPGPADEAGQTAASYAVAVTGTTGTLAFTAAPAIGTNGTLTYTAAPNANGTATITVTVTDSGGATSAPQTFVITVNAVNDAPAVTLGANPTVAQDAGGQSVPNFTVFAPGGGSDEAGQTPTYTVTSSNPALFGVQPSIAPNGTLTFTPAPGASGTATVTVVVKDNGGTANGGADTGAPKTFAITVEAPERGPTARGGIARSAQFIAIGTAAGTLGTARVLTADTRTLVRDVIPFAGYIGGLNVALGDLDGDGTDDLIVATASGASHVKAFDIASGRELLSFLAFGGFTGGVDVAAGDVDGDGRAEIVVGAGAGAPGGHVKVFGSDGAERRSFLAFEGFTGGVKVAAGDVTGDGRADVVVLASPGGNGHVKVFDGAAGSLVTSFFGYEGYLGDIGLAVGDADGDGFAEVITTAQNPANGTHLKAFDRGAAVVRSFFAPPAAGAAPRADRLPIPVPATAARVAVGDFTGDRVLDYLLGSQPGAGASRVLLIDGATGAALDDRFAFSEGFGLGIEVG